MSNIGESWQFDEKFAEVRPKRKIPWLLIFTVVVLVALLLMLILRLFFFETIKVSGTSMEPFLLKGSTHLISKYRGQELQRGEIIAFRNPTSRGMKLVQRIAALPGERVEIRAGRLYIDYAERALPVEGMVLNDDFAVITVPDNHYFVMGDNANKAIDSREFGCVPADMIIGTVAAHLGEGEYEVERLPTTKPMVFE